MTIRAVIYPRYSSDNQREESIEAQVRACTEYCKAKGYVIVGTYPDTATSARSDNRPNFQRMIADAKRGMFDVVVVHKLDRFSRDRYDHAFYKRELRQAGVRLESVLERLDDSPESVILEAMLEGISEYTSKNLAREVMKGLRENALACKHTGGVPPLGYNVGADKRYELNAREAEGVRYIYTAYLDGAGYDTICRWLREKGIRGKRGGAITPASLHDILQNEKYTGVYIYNRTASKDAMGKRNNRKNKSEEDIIRIEGGMPEIISKQLFERVQDKMQKNKSGKQRAKEPYLLSGIIFCGECGGAMVGNSRGRARSDTEVPKKYYECATRRNSGECNMLSVQRDEVEETVLDYIEGLVSPETINAIAVYITDNAERFIENRKEELQSAKKNLAEAARNAELILDKILSGLDSETLRSRLKETEDRKFQLEVKVTELQIAEAATAPITKEGISSYLSQLSGLRTLTREQQSAIIKQFIQRVTVYARSPDGREIKINTALGELIDRREDKKGGGSGPP